MSLSRRSRWSQALVFAAIALMLGAGVAEARAGRGGGGFGSRGSRGWTAPPPTRTIPNETAPLQRQATPANPSVAPRTAPAAAPASRGMFSTRGGFMGGLVGAGLLGMFLGYGLFGGLGGLGSILGLLLQVVLIVWIARMAVGFFRSRRQPAYAGATLNRDAAMGGATGPSPQPARGMGGGGAGPARQAARRPSDEVGIGQGDLDSFERLLTNVQVAYADEDVGRLRELATPEAAGHLAEELAANRGRGLVNHMADVKLLQGDLAEAWREDGLEYATAAMRYRLVDYVEETATGRVVEGDPSRPTEVAEHWTFVRRPGESWRVSAIQAA